LLIGADFDVNAGAFAWQFIKNGITFLICLITQRHALPFA
jgi:hypothetical protein